MRQQIERTGGRAYFAGSDPQIASRGCQAAVTEQQLNGPDIGTRFEQVNGECVTQAMRLERLGNVAESMRLLASLLHSILGDVLPRSVAREQPMAGSCHSPPLAQRD